MEKFRAMRPEGIYEKILKQRELDGIRFYKENRDAFLKASCPSCESKENKFAFEKWGYEHFVCKNCATLYCNPRPSGELLETFYSQYDAPKMWTDLLIESDTNRKRLQYQPRVEKLLTFIEKNKKRKGVAVDLGAGSGAFALALKYTGRFEDVLALDLSEECVKICKKAGLNSKKGDTRRIDDEYAELVCMNDLIEHIHNPFELLTDCYRIIENDGYLQIATPNGEGFDFKILKEKTKNITPPEHINYFNPNSIEILLKRVGFKEVFVETPGILDVEIILNEIKNGLSLRESNEFLGYLMEQDEKVLYNLQEFLIKSKLSSHMLVVAKK